METTKLFPELWARVFHYCFREYETLKIVTSSWLNLLKTITPSTNLEFQECLRLNLIPTNKPITSLKLFLNEESIICMILKNRVDLLQQFDATNWPLLKRLSVFQKLQVICLFIASDKIFRWFFDDSNFLFAYYDQKNVNSFHFEGLTLIIHTLKTIEKKYGILYDIKKYCRVSSLFRSCFWLSMIDIKGVNDSNINLLEHDLRLKYQVKHFLEKGQVHLITTPDVVNKIFITQPIEFKYDNIVISRQLFEICFRESEYYQSYLDKHVFPKMMTFDSVDFVNEYIAPRSKFWFHPKLTPSGKLSLRFCDRLFNLPKIPINFHPSHHLSYDIYVIRQSIPSDLPFGLTCFLATRYGLSDPYNDVNMWTTIIEDEFLDTLKDEFILIDIIEWIKNQNGSHRINNTIRFSKIGSGFVFKGLIKRWIIDVCGKNDLWFFDCATSPNISQIEYWEFLLTLEDRMIQLPSSCNKMYEIIHNIEEYEFLQKLSPLQFPIDKNLLTNLLKVFIHFDRFDIIEEIAKNLPCDYEFCISHFDLKYNVLNNLNQHVVSYCRKMRFCY